MIDSINKQMPVITSACSRCCGNSTETDRIHRPENISKPSSYLINQQRSKTRPQHQNFGVSEPSDLDLTTDDASVLFYPALQPVSVADAEERSRGTEPDSGKLLNCSNRQQLKSSVQRNEKEKKRRNACSL